jgi:hypothetical protein
MEHLEQVRKRELHGLWEVCTMKFPSIVRSSYCEVVLRATVIRVEACPLSV